MSGDTADDGLLDRDALHSLTHDPQPVVIALPHDPAVGEMVEVVGAGAAGWRIAQGLGQSINAQGLGLVAGLKWAAHEQVRDWMSISSSADGRRLMATVYGGRIHVSDD